MIRLTKIRENLEKRLVKIGKCNQRHPGNHHFSPQRLDAYNLKDEMSIRDFLAAAHIDILLDQYDQCEMPVVLSSSTQQIGVCLVGISMFNLSRSAS